MGEAVHKLMRFGVRALRIAASTIAIVALLRSDWRAGTGAALAWLAFVTVEKRLPPWPDHPSEPGPSPAAEPAGGFETTAEP